jgi:hypothetical protein
MSRIYAVRLLVGVLTAAVALSVLVAVLQAR